MNRKRLFQRILSLGVVLILVTACGIPVLTPTPTPIPPTVTPSPTTILEGWSSRNDHYYRLTDPMSWSEAEAQAVQWGGHLVTINDREEELYLRNQFGSQEYFWLGFNDIQVEGIWVWTGGEPITYTNWCEGEPNNLNVETNRPEDVAIMNWGKDGTYADSWNDVLSDVNNRGIVERYP